MSCRVATKQLAISLALGCGLALSASAARAATTTLAVAANFSAAMQHIIAAFEAEQPHQATLSSGSSGQLFAQIHHGAPYDAFFSADQSKPRRLIDDNLAVSGSQFTYAIGALVLWSAQDDLVDPAGRVLRDGQYARLALANPRLAPYGAAAVQALDALGLVDHTRPRWVMGENIAQTYQFVRSGNAPLGLVALSQVSQAGHIHHGSAWRLPATLHAPIRQDAVLLRRGRDNPATRALLKFVRSPQVAKILSDFGYRQDSP